MFCAMLPLLKWLKGCRRINVLLMTVIFVAMVNLMLLYQLNWSPVTQFSSSFAAKIVRETPMLQIGNRWNRNALTLISSSYPTVHTTPTPQIVYRAHFNHGIYLSCSNTSKIIQTTPLPLVETSSRRLIGRTLGRLGNEMFIYASLLGIADRNKMIAVYKSQQLRKWFGITADESAESEDNVKETEVRERSAYIIESRFGQLASTYTGDVIIKGFFQCWRYFDEVEDLVRHEFQFSRDLRNFTSTFLRTNTRLDGDAVYVGVHIRRGDMLADYNVNHGYTVADDEYLQRAVKFLINRLTQQQNYDSKPVGIVFVVCSDDIDWSKRHFADAVSRSVIFQNQMLSVTHAGEPSLTSYSPQTSNNHQNESTGTTGTASSFTASLNDNILIVSTPSVRTQVIYSSGFADGQDLALLSQCNHTIMTVGTFGWWAGYLAGGITIYYKDFPAKNSQLYFQFRRREFFPPDWIGL